MNAEIEINKRLKWIRLYERTQNAGLVCLRCGISRPTLRKWLKRYLEKGEQGLIAHSRKPHSSPALKAVGDLKEKIISLRRERRLGARRIQNELLRLYSIRTSLATIHKVLQRNHEKPLLRKMAFRKAVKRYQKEVPGERIQMDVCKIAPGLYQYTAIDDCTRYRVLALYNRRTAANTLKFLEKIIEEMPFAIPKDSNRSR